MSVNIPSVYDEHVDVVEGSLEINAETVIGSAIVRDSGAIRVSDGNSLEILADELVVQSGSVSGHIAGTDVLRKTTMNAADLGNLPGFDGTIELAEGSLDIHSGDSLGTTSGATHITRERNATLFTRGPMTIRDDLFLENATGVDYGGALVVHGSRVTVEGRLDLGLEGSVIGGLDSSGSTSRIGKLDTVGPITGGSLVTTGGDFTLTILNSDNTYTGITNIREGTVILENVGTLTSTAAIVLHDDIESDKGRLSIDNHDVNLPDRVADSIPFEMRGGKIDMRDSDLEAVNESLGTVTFIEGVTVHGVAAF